MEGVALGAMECSEAKNASRSRRRGRRTNDSFGLGACVVLGQSNELGSARIELFGAERLRQKVVRTELDCAGVLILLACGGEDDAGHLAPTFVPAHCREN